LIIYAIEYLGVVFPSRTTTEVTAFYSACDHKVTRCYMCTAHISVLIDCVWCLFQLRQKIANMTADNLQVRNILVFMWRQFFCWVLLILINNLELLCQVGY